MPNAKWQMMANGKWQMANAKMANAKVENRHLAFDIRHFEGACRFWLLLCSSVGWGGSD
jgi:hypothetical protein